MQPEVIEIRQTVPDDVDEWRFLCDHGDSDLHSASLRGRVITLRRVWSEYPRNVFRGECSECGREYVLLPPE